MHYSPCVLLCQTAVNATTAELLRKQEELEKKARELERRERELESHSLGPGAGKKENISRKHKETGTAEAKKKKAVHHSSCL